MSFVYSDSKIIIYRISRGNKVDDIARYMADNSLRKNALAYFNVLAKNIYVAC